MLSPSPDRLTTNIATVLSFVSLVSCFFSILFRDSSQVFLTPVTFLFARSRFLGTMVSHTLVLSLPLRTLPWAYPSFQLFMRHFTSHHYYNNCATYDYTSHAYLSILHTLFCQNWRCHVFSRAVSLYSLACLLVHRKRS